MQFDVLPPRGDVVLFIVYNASPMLVIVNTLPTDIPEQSTLAQLLVSQGLQGSPCAVEVNKTLVPKREHNQHVLAPDDTIEIVTLVGGG
jgi:thiamine biosynthesis protein ThiS